MTDERPTRQECYDAAPVRLYDQRLTQGDLEALPPCSWLERCTIALSRSTAHPFCGEHNHVMEADDCVLEADDCVLEADRPMVDWSRLDDHGHRVYFCLNLFNWGDNMTSEADAFAQGYGAPLVTA